MPEKSFYDVVTKHVEKLELYTKAITKAHGESHPEAYEVRELFEAIRKKIKEAGTGKPDLDAEFERLRKVTDHYTVPQDVCETYAAVYHMLSEADQAYHA